MPKWLMFFHYISSSSAVASVVAVAMFGFALIGAATPSAQAQPSDNQPVISKELAEVPNASGEPVALGQPTVVTQEVAPAPVYNPVTAAPVVQKLTPPVTTGCGASRPYIYIPSVNLCMNIITVGLDADGRIGTPSNGYQAGWYNQSNYFGTGGTTFLDGHSWGSFGAIKGVYSGTTITIGLPDGRDLNYRVTGTEVIGLDNWVEMMTKALYTPGLNLMTCHGANDSQRFIVYSVQI